MKRIKKNKFRLILAGVMVFGIFLSMIPFNSNADVEARIPCNSCAIQVSGFSYVDCAECIRIEGWDDDGCEGKCAPN